TCGEIFAMASQQASSNYGIGSDGRIAMYVEEKNRSWCTSSASNDHRAVTIEVANDGDDSTGWHISDKAYAALIDLCTDICKRNGIKELKWQGDKSLIGQVDKQNMTVHRWFANKSCPGDYLYNLHGQIAKEVNARLNGTASSDVLYRVQTGAFSVKENAEAQLAKVKAVGFDAFVTQADGLYKIQVGAFGVRANAEAMAAKLEAAGFSTYITTDGTGSAVNSSTYKAGTKLELSNVGLYASCTSKTATCFVTGDYYLYDGIKNNDMLRICPKSANVGKLPIVENVTGWVKASDIK
ncbi:MAG: SPOR domain-containing protein, partial [Oscillospiraceae bacterium]|nr:SPOR domain-containing protein [Oscillospiraceae bacterium]